MSDLHDIKKKMKGNKKFLIKLEIFVIFFDDNPIYIKKALDNILEKLYLNLHNNLDSLDDSYNSDDFWD